MKTALTNDEFEKLRLVAREYAYFNCDCDRSGDYCIHEEPKSYFEDVLREIGLLGRPPGSL